MIRKLPGLLFILFVVTKFAGAQHHTPLPHGMVYGIKPSTIGLMPAFKVEAFMGKQTRISAVLSGTVLAVTKPKGGWFTIDAGNGKVITAHFRDAKITIPADLKGREIIVEGVVQKDFIADDLQHMAGDTVKGKIQHKVNTDPKRRLALEVKGLMVNK